MSGYEAPNRIKYAFMFDAGNNGNETFTIKGPKGKTGRLYDYGVEGVTEAFTADAQVSVGTAADPDAFGEEIAIGVLAVDTVKSLRTLYNPGYEKTSFDALLVDPTIPADTLVQLTITDDASAGIGTFFAIIDWDD